MMQNEIGFKPVGDVIVIERDEAKQGLIILVNQTPMLSGVVRAAGPGKRLPNGTIMPLPVSVGDRIMFGEYAGQKAMIGGKEYVVMREGDIIGAFDE